MSYVTCAKTCGIPIAVGALLLIFFVGADRSGHRDAIDSGEPSKIRFEEVTARAGIDYTGMSFGAAWGDWNGDGYPDLWASGHSPMRLLESARGERFIDRTREIIGPPRYSDRHNAAWADIDNDGDEDLLQSAGGARGFAADNNALFINEDGRMEDRAQALGIAYGQSRGRAVLWLDVDADGRLDALMTGAHQPQAPPALFQWDGTSYRSTPLGFIDQSESAQLASLDDSNGLYVVTGLPHEVEAQKVAENGFVPAGDALGLTEFPGYWVYDTLVADLDNDLRDDILFVRGRLSSAYSLAEDGLTLDARLQALSNRPSGLEIAGPGSITVRPFPLSAVWWTKDRIFIGEKGNPPQGLPVELSSSDPEVAGLAQGDKGLYIGFEPDRQRWTIEARDPVWSSVNLQVSAGEPITSVDAHGFSPVLAPLEQNLRWNQEQGFSPLTPVVDGNCFGGASGDFDNDGDLDIYLVCSGYLRNAPNMLLENLGGREFRLVEGAAGAAGSTIGLGDSVAVADYDLDGFLDLLVRNGSDLPPFGKGPDQLFRNLGNANHWIELDLEGTSSNRNGIGSVVKATCNGDSQRRLADNGSHGRVQDFRRIHFGLGRCRTNLDVEVAWPSGEVRTYRGLEPDRIWVLSESGQSRRRFEDAMATTSTSEAAPRTDEP